MKIWQNFLAKTTVWLAAEVVLNLLGLDNLADYSEFMLDKKVFKQPSHTLQVSAKYSLNQFNAAKIAFAVNSGGNGKEVRILGATQNPYFFRTIRV